MQIFRWLLAFFGLPLLWALGKTLLQGWAIAFCDQQGGWGSPLAIFLYGVGVMFVIYFCLHQTISIVYVFAHEMTHLLVGLLFFARPKRIEIHHDEGCVELTKINCVIILAPYAVPFYLLVAFCIQAFLLWSGMNPFSMDVWIFIYGICAGHHLIYTGVSILTVGQPDLREYGRLFSYWLILSVKLILATLPLILIATSNWSMRKQCASTVEHTTEIYQQLCQKIQVQYSRCFTTEK
jgi:hypothetical protein